jgi:hypothetical protein
MEKTFLKIALSIILGFIFLRIGFEAKKDNVSIIVQSLGYVSISYPFILFFKFFIGKIIHDIKSIKRNK